MEQATENVIEFIRNEGRATVTFSQPRFMALVRKLAARYPDKVTIIHDKDENGYFLAHVPVSFLSIRAPRELSEEEKERRRLQIARASRHLTESNEAKTDSVSIDDDLYFQEETEGF